MWEIYNHPKQLYTNNWFSVVGIQVFSNEANYYAKAALTTQALNVR